MVGPIILQVDAMRAIPQKGPALGLNKTGPYSPLVGAVTEGFCCSAR